MKYAFSLSIVGIIALTLLGIRGNINVSTEVAGIVTAFILAVGGSNASHVWAASKDASADTVKAIEITK